MNVVAAIKAYQRQDDDVAMQFLQRGYERVGAVRRVESLAAQLLELVTAIDALDPSTRPLVLRILSLIDETL